MPIKIPPAQIRSHYESKVIVKPETGCMEYTGRKNAQGYGQVGVGGVTRGLHRVMWEAANGPIPDGLHILHSCDNPSCIKLAHLRAGTRSDNMRDMFNRKRCVRDGHPKISKETVTQIRSMYANNCVTQAELARAFGLSQPQISRIVRLENWGLTYVDE